MMNRMKMIALMLTLAMTVAAFVGCADKGQTPDLTIEPDATVNEPAAMPELPADAGEGQPASMPEEAAQAEELPDAAELGITMLQKPRTLTTEMQEITFIIDNTSETDFSTDMVQHLEKLVDGEWQQVLPIYDAVTMNLIAVPAGSMTEITFLFNGYYDAPEAGTYRLTKTLVDAEGNAYALSTEFDVF